MVEACLSKSILSTLANSSQLVFIAFVVLLFAVSILGTPLVTAMYLRRVQVLMNGRADPNRVQPVQPAPPAATPQAGAADPGEAVDAQALVQAAERRIRSLRAWLVATVVLYVVPAAGLLAYSPMKIESGKPMPLALQEHGQAWLALSDLLLLGALCAPMVLIGISHPRFGRLFWRWCAPVIVLALCGHVALTDAGEPVPAFIAALVFALPFVALLYRAMGNRHARNVAPLLAVACGTVLFGLLAAAVLAMASYDCLLEPETGWVASTIGILALPVTVASPVLLVWLALRLVRWLSHAYQHKRYSEAQLQQGCWWLVLLAVSAVGVGGLDDVVGPWLPALGGVAAGVFGFYLFGTRRLHPWPRPQHLLLLRVFSHDERGERLLDQAAFRWRFVGPIMMIGGPDMAKSMLDPHELLLFLRRRIRDQFVSDADDLRRQIAAMDVRPDPDGRYRVNEFFCRDNTWRDAVERLLERSDAVLLDLRGFTEQRGGTAYEIGLLARRDALARTVFLVDDSTDRAAVLRTLQAEGATEAAAGQVMEVGREPDGEAVFQALARAAALRAVPKPLPGAGQAALR